MARGDLLKGFVLGVAVGLVVPVAKRVLGERGKPLGQAAVRLGGVLSDKAREVAAEIAEITEDTVAELQGSRSIIDEQPKSDNNAAPAEEAAKTGTE